MTIKFVSSDLNGTLVHQHTMSDLIRVYGKKEDFEKADSFFKKQTSGKCSMKEAFAVAGPLTKGITLRQAIEYAENHMTYVSGFREFIGFLAQKKMPFVINSTGYTITFYAIRKKFGRDKIHGFIGNRLFFAIDGDQNKELNEEQLKDKVEKFMSGDSNNDDYDKIKTTGRIELGIINDEAKAGLILEYLEKNFKDISPNECVHIGDTMGDSGGILGIAKLGGLGIAFNYNRELEEFLKNKIKTKSIVGRICFVDPKGESADLGNIIHILDFE